MSDIRLVFFKTKQAKGTHFPPMPKVASYRPMKKKKEGDTEEHMLDKEQKEATKHPDKLGAGAKKRKKLKGQKKIGVVMHEFKRGTLHSGGGGKVKSRKQAIAIAMSEAGLSKDKKNKKKIKKSKEIKLTLAKAAVGSTLASHKYIRKEGERYIYDEPKEKGKGTLQNKPGTIGHLKLMPDGFYYDKHIKITDNPDKAKEYISKKQGAETLTQRLTPQIGSQIRINPTSKSLGRGIMATVSEIDKKENTVRIKDEKGRFFRVKLNELKVAKSSNLFEINQNLLKSDDTLLLLKAKELPIGHITTLRNGQKVKKVSQKKWEYVSETEKDIGFKDISSDEIENLKKDKVLRDRFINQNQPLVGGTVKKIINKFPSLLTSVLTISQKDALNWGNIKFLEAIQGFDTKKATSGAFLTYVQTAIARDLFQRITREITHKLDKEALSLEEGIASDKEGKESKLGATITQEHIPSAKEEIAKKGREEDVKKWKGVLEEIKKEYKLAPKTKKLIDILTGGKVKTQRDIAKKLKISPVAVNKKIDEIKKIAKKYLAKSFELIGFIKWLKSFKIK